MSTIALALHLVRRDLAHRRWIVAGWLVLVALITLDAVSASPVPAGAATRLVLLPLGALFLAAGIVKLHPPEGAPPGTPAYWRTLPIPLRAVLLGRVAAAALLLCVLPLMGQAVALVALDTPPAHLPEHLVASAVPLVGVVLGGLLVGSLTRGIGGAAVLITGLYLLVFPLAFAMTMIGSGPGLLPPVPGISLVLHLGVAGLALWMLALRHALDPGNWWTRLGAIVAVLALVGVNQTGWFVSVSESRDWAASPPEAGATSFPVAVDGFSLVRSETSSSRTTSLPDDAEGAREGRWGDADDPIDVRFAVRPGEGAPSPGLVLVHMVTLEDADGRMLLMHRDPGVPIFSEFSTYVNLSVSGGHLEGLRSGSVVLVVHGQGLELEPTSPMELRLEVGAHASHRGHRVVVEEVVPDRLTLRWSAFTSRVSMRAPARGGAGMGAASFLEVEMVDPSGGAGELLSHRGTSSSFGALGNSDLVVVGPTRQSHAISFAVPRLTNPDARVRVHTLEPMRATLFRMEIPAVSWEGGQR